MHTTQRDGRRRNRRLTVAIGTALALMTGAVGAWAAHFPDVPNANPFHDDVDWLAQAGVTLGFPDGTYRPDAGVTRGEMAAFIRRGAPKVTFFDDALSASSTVPTGTWEQVAGLGTVTKDHPGTALEVTLQTQVRTVDAGGIGSCQWQLRVAGQTVTGDVAPAGPQPGDLVLAVNGAPPSYSAAHLEATFLDLPAGDHAVTLHLRGTADSCLPDVGGFDDRTTVTEFTHRS